MHISGGLLRVKRRPREGRSRAARRKRAAAVAVVAVSRAAAPVEGSIINETLAELTKVRSGHRKVLVAYSGGKDSVVVMDLESLASA